jgi:hypothetical protein
MPFPNVVNRVQAPGVAGDIASTNPRSSIVAGPGALVSPPGGVKVGNFAWVGPTGNVSAEYVSGYQVGFVLRNEQALITEFLGEATLGIPSGFMLTLMNGGDYWAFFPAGATVGNNVYADPNTGTPLAGASAPTLGTATASAGFDGTATLVDASTTLNVTAVTHGYISPGDNVSDSTTGANIPAGTTIISQLTGTAGGVGTYQMSAAATAGAVGDTVVTSSDYMVVTAIADGSLNVGDVFSGTDVSVNSQITGQAKPFSGVGSIVTGSLSALVITSVVAGSDLLRKGAVLPAIAGLGIAAGTTITTQTAGTPGGVGTYTLSAAGTAGAGVPVTTDDSAGGTGLYSINPGNQIFGAASAPETITVAGTAESTGFVVSGTYSQSSGGVLAKISKAAV